MRLVLIPANENFIVVKPKRLEHTLPMLALLNSTVAEFLLRVAGQIYGSGVCDLRPDHVKLLPIPDLNMLDSNVLRRLVVAYQAFLRTDGQDRSAIDACMQSILHGSPTLMEDIRNDYRAVIALSCR